MALSSLRAPLELFLLLAFTDTQTSYFLYI